MSTPAYNPQRKRDNQSNSMPNNSNFKGDVDNSNYDSVMSPLDISETMAYIGQGVKDPVIAQTTNVSINGQPDSLTPGKASKKQGNVIQFSSESGSGVHHHKAKNMQVIRKND